MTRPTRHACAFIFVLATLATWACQGETTANADDPSTTDEADPAAANDDADDPGTPPAQIGPAPAPEPGGEPSLSPVPALDGPAGPTAVPLPMRPDEYSAAVVFGDRGGVVWRGELDGDECTESDLERCHPWYVSWRARDGSGETTNIRFAEIDSPSGIDVEAVLPADEDLILVWREGRYAGDLHRLMALWLDTDGEPMRPAFDVLGGASSEIRNATAARLPDGALALCWSGDDPASARAIDRLERRIACRRASRAGIAGELQVFGPDGSTARAPALAFADDRGVLTWITDETLFVAIVDGNLQSVVETIALGPATARQATVIAGHGGFLVAWQGADGGLRAQRLERDGGRPGPVLQLGTDDEPLAHVMPSGGGAVPDAFLLAVNAEPDARLVIVKPDGSSASVETLDDTQLLLDGAAAVVLPAAGSNDATWRSAASLVAP